MAKWDIAILGRTGSRSKPVTVTQSPRAPVPVDEEEENRLMREDDGYPLWSGR